MMARSISKRRRLREVPSIFFIVTRVIKNVLRGT